MKNRSETQPDHENTLNHQLQALLETPVDTEKLSGADFKLVQQYFKEYTGMQLPHLFASLHGFQENPWMILDQGGTLPLIAASIDTDRPGIQRPTDIALHTVAILPTEAKRNAPYRVSIAAINLNNRLLAASYTASEGKLFEAAVSLSSEDCPNIRRVEEGCDLPINANDVWAYEQYIRSIEWAQQNTTQAPGIITQRQREMIHGHESMVRFFDFQQVLVANAAHVPFEQEIPPYLRMIGIEKEIEQNGDTRFLSMGQIREPHSWGARFPLELQSK